MPSTRQTDPADAKIVRTRTIAPDAPGAATRDKPWLFRTYSGHSSATASNELYRTNLGRGQTGLSVAFDLPTQTGYRSEEHTSELQSLMRISYAVFCLKKKTSNTIISYHVNTSVHRTTIASSQY